MPDTKTITIKPAKSRPMLTWVGKKPLRTVKRGNTPGQQFYGCPNYPRCRAVIPIKLPAPVLN
jgi:ssDNA-binding Zn-finger/Zn-ribbon topoisomerase 1